MCHFYLALQIIPWKQNHKALRKLVPSTASSGLKYITSKMLDLWWHPASTKSCLSYCTRHADQRCVWRNTLQNKRYLTNTCIGGGTNRSPSPCQSQRHQHEVYVSYLPRNSPTLLLQTGNSFTPLTARDTTGTQGEPTFHKQTPLRTGSRDKTEAERYYKPRMVTRMLLK